jgi:hypothetical protein
MRILLDSKDLIDVVEHNRPVTVDDFRVYLRDHGSSLVLTFNNFRELVAPLSRGIDSLHMRDVLQKLETLPVCYLGEMAVLSEETKSAIRAFNSGREYEPISPYVSRWDETLPGPRPPVGRMLILRLDEIVLGIAGEDPSVFAGYDFYEEALRHLFASNRCIPAPIRVPEENFPNVFRRLIPDYGIEKPTKQISDFAAWVYENPRRCPALRLDYEVFHEVLRNLGDIPKASDIPDLCNNRSKAIELLEFAKRLSMKPLS